MSSRHPRAGTQATPNKLMSSRHPKAGTQATPTNCNHANADADGGNDENLLGEELEYFTGTTLKRCMWNISNKLVKCMTNVCQIFI